MLVPTITVEEGHHLDAWKGSVDDIADLFERACELVESVAPTDSGLHPSVSATLETADLSFDSVKEFREYAQTGKLEKVDEASLFMMSHGADQLKLSVTLRATHTASGGARFSVAGTDHVAVSGIAQQLRHQLDQGKRHRPREALLRTPLFLLSSVVGIGFAIAVERSGVLTALLAVVGGALVFLNAFLDSIVDRLVPALEILDPNDPKTIYERWRGKLLAATGAVVLVVIGAVLQALLRS